VLNKPLREHLACQKTIFDPRISVSMGKKLNQLEATAICGNDIGSSFLYVSALTIVYAGHVH